MALDYGKELNFEEAVNKSFLLYQSKELPYNIEEIF